MKKNHNSSIFYEPVLCLGFVAKLAWFSRDVWRLWLWFVSHACLLFFPGGNLGLFTGMSILSFFEIIFWVIRGLVTSLQPIRLRKWCGSTHIDVPKYFSTQILFFSIVILSFKIRRQTSKYIFSRNKSSVSVNVEFSLWHVKKIVGGFLASVQATVI